MPVVSRARTAGSVWPANGHGSSCRRTIALTVIACRPHLVRRVRCRRESPGQTHLHLPGACSSPSAADCQAERCLALEQGVPCRTGSRSSGRSRRPLSCSSYQALFRLPNFTLHSPEIAAPQKIQLCAAPANRAEWIAPVQNGGSARGYLGRWRLSVVLV